MLHAGYPGVLGVGCSLSCTLDMCSFLCMHQRKSHRKKSTQSYSVRQNVTPKCSRSRVGAVGPSMLPKPGTELEWAPLCCCGWALNAAVCLGMPLPGLCPYQYLTLDYLCICLFSVSPTRVWSHCRHVVNTQQIFIGCICLYFLPSLSRICLLMDVFFHLYSFLANIHRLI